MQNVEQMKVSDAAARTRTHTHTNTHVHTNMCTIVMPATLAMYTHLYVGTGVASSVHIDAQCTMVSHSVYMYICLNTVHACMSLYVLM